MKGKQLRTMKAVKTVLKVELTVFYFPTTLYTLIKHEMNRVLIQKARENSYQPQDWDTKGGWKSFKSFNDGVKQYHTWRIFKLEVATRTQTKRTFSDSRGTVRCCSSPGRSSVTSLDPTFLSENVRVTHNDLWGSWIPDPVDSPTYPLESLTENKSLMWCCQSFTSGNYLLL